MADCSSSGRGEESVITTNSIPAWNSHPGKNRNGGRSHLWTDGSLLPLWDKGSPAAGGGAGFRRKFGIPGRQLPGGIFGNGWLGHDPGRRSRAGKRQQAAVSPRGLQSKEPAAQGARRNRRNPRKDVGREAGERTVHAHGKSVRVTGASVQLDKFPEAWACQV